MNEDYFISIDGTMELEDGQDDKVQMMTRGSFVRKNNSYYIVYHETEATGYAGCTTTVKVAMDESCVTMRRYGENTSQLVIEKGVRHLCHYDVGAAALTLGVAADEIHSHLTDEGGTVEFSYTLDSDRDMFLSRNLVRISVRRAEGVDPYAFRE